MAQPKGYAAFLLFPHLKMIPRLNVSVVQFHSIDAFHLTPLDASIMAPTSAIPFPTKPSRICRCGNAN